MSERVSDDTLRRWCNTLTPGQAALCAELLDLRAQVARVRSLVADLEEDDAQLVETDAVAREIRHALEPEPDGER